VPDVVIIFPFLGSGRCKNHVAFVLSLIVGDVVWLYDYKGCLEWEHKMLFYIWI
jgi:hypothetical protein